MKTKTLSILVLALICVTIFSETIAGTDTNSPQQYSNWYGLVAAVAEKNVVLSGNIWTCSVTSRTKNPPTIIQQIGWTYWKCGILCNDVPLGTPYSEGPVIVTASLKTNSVNLSYAMCPAGQFRSFSSWGGHDFNQAGAPHWTPYVWYEKW